MMGKSVDYLMEIAPNTQIEEYTNDKFRYVINSIEEVSTGEIIAHKAKYAIVSIYLFSDKSGKLIRYQIERKTFR